LAYCALLTVQPIDRVEEAPPSSTFRWTSIGFQGFACDGTASGKQACQEPFIAGEKVTVTVTAKYHNPTRSRRRECQHTSRLYRYTK
jgi:hypothetical protein